MNVAIGVSSGEIGRYSHFYDALLHLRGVTPTNVIHAKGGSVSESRNGIQAIAKARGYEAILYLDDDQVFSPDTLERLIAHDKDVVSGLYLKRQPPFIPHAYHNRTEPGRVVEHDDSGMERKIAEKWDVNYLRPMNRGLVNVDMVGAGCLLVKMHVFDKLQKPYWTLGQGDHKDLWADDEMFCRSVRAAGFDIWCDLETSVGHHFGCSIWPKRLPNGHWVSALLVGNEVAVAFPAAEPPPSNVEIPTNGQVLQVARG